MVFEDFCFFLWFFLNIFEDFMFFLWFFQIFFGDFLVNGLKILLDGLEDVYRKLFLDGWMDV